MSTSEGRTRAARDRYDAEGYAIVERAIDDTLVAAGRRHIEWLLDRYPDRKPEELTHDLVVRDPFWVRLVTDERLLDIVESFIGADIALFASHYIAKPPGEGQPVLWHQDGVYWPISPKTDVITVWLALDQTRPANGCMQVIPGSHTLALQEIRENTEIENVLDSEIDMDINESDAIPIELEPGDISLHHPNILHGSENNRSYTWRRGLTIRYIPATTSITEEDWESALMLRGEPAGDVNAYHPWPTHDGNNAIDFVGVERYNERAREMNDRVAAADVLQ